MTTNRIFTEYRDIIADFEDLLAGDFRRGREPEVPVRILLRPSAPPAFPAASADIGAAAAAAAGTAAPPPASGTPEERRLSLEELAAEVRSCSLCRLAEGRNRAVPGTGVPEPLVLVIGEGPGAEEDRQGLPFVGPAGRFLDKWLEAVGLSRDTNAFIANVVKCRPPGNRDPQPDESAACMPYLARQAEILRPRAVLAVGRIAAQNLLGTAQGIGALRGRVFSWRGIPLVATYHPSAVLRDPGLKRPVWEDLKKLKELLGGV